MAKSVRWCFDLLSWRPNASVLSLLLSSILREEQSRIERFIFKRDALASLVGRLLIRLFCCRSFGLRWDEIVLKRDGNNKPFVDGIDACFNVSHQGRYVILAGEIGRFNIGCDVMKQEYTGGKPISEFFRLMNRNFSSYEWSFILSDDDTDRQIREFFRLWTLKESYVKATGTGITIPLDSIEFHIASSLHSQHFINDTKIYIDSVEQNNWMFQEIQLDDDHCAAVAISDNHSDNLASAFITINPSDIMTHCKSLFGIDEESGLTLFNKPFSP